MSLSTISGEIQTQPLNDNYSYLNGKLNQIALNIKDYGAVGDGVNDDTPAIQDAYDDLQTAGGGIILKPYANYYTTSTVFKDNINSETIRNSENGGILNIIEGESGSPTTFNTPPNLISQKYVRYDNDGDEAAHQIGAGLFEVISEGNRTGGAQDTEGAWIGLVGNSILDVQNIGTPTVQDWDAKGDVIGLMGSAEATGYPGNNHIVTALWANAISPELDTTTYGAISGSFATCGLEVNVWIRHEDAGKKDSVTGKGTSIGIFCNNYQEPTNIDIRDWSFGMVIQGTPHDGNYSDLDIDNWNGIHTGILINTIKNRGIYFGPYADDGSYGIEFCSNYSTMSHRPLAGIMMGDNVLNMGTYYGGTYTAGDLFRNGEHLYFNKDASNQEVITTYGNYASGDVASTHKIAVKIGTTTFYLMATTVA